MKQDSILTDGHISQTFRLFFPKYLDFRLDYSKTLKIPKLGNFWILFKTNADFRCNFDFSSNITNINNLKGKVIISMWNFSKSFIMTHRFVRIFWEKFWGKWTFFLHFCLVIERFSIFSSFTKWKMTSIFTNISKGFYVILESSNRTNPAVIMHELFKIPICQLESIDESVQ